MALVVRQMKDNEKLHTPFHLGKSCKNSCRKMNIIQKYSEFKKHSDAFVPPPVERTWGYVRKGLEQINDL